MDPQHPTLGVYTDRSCQSVPDHPDGVLRLLHRGSHQLMQFLPHELVDNHRSIDWVGSGGAPAPGRHPLQDQGTVRGGRAGL